MRITNNNLEIVENSDLIIIAVKPHVVSPILQEVSSKVTREKLFLSIAAGVTLETLEKVGGPPQKPLMIEDLMEDLF